MPLDRRQMMAASAAAVAAGLIPHAVRAEVQAGNGTLITLSDGHLELPKSFALGDLPEDLANPVLARHGFTGDMLRSPCNVTLYRDDTRVVLFDVGSGTDFVSTAGLLFDGLDVAGVSPEDITDVVFTHGHPDHLWGLLDDFDDLAFPDARFHIGRAEWDYWQDPETVDTIDPGRQSFAVGAKRRLDAIEDRIAFFDDGDEVLPGIAALATFGHTPGHMAFEVGASDPVFVVGDAIVNSHLSLANLAWELGSDQNPERAAATRTSLVNRLSQGQHRLVGFHFPGSGIGRIEPADTGFRFQEDAT
ncbi:MAG: MBL fold metallo-hydrolase [Silicimonas sp.]|nr:MBL fold metallo-hydrolase [Silicimonas sp.]